MPYLAHSFVSPKADGSDTSLVRPSNWNDILEYTTDAVFSPTGTNAYVRECLAGNRTYYVRTDGSDSNNGLANTAGGAFVTIQHAYDVACQTLDFRGNSVTIQIADGTYTGGIVSSFAWGVAGNLIIQGNTATPANVVINTTDYSFYFGGYGGPGRLYLKGFKMTTSVSGCPISIQTTTGLYDISAVSFGGTAGSNLGCINVGGPFCRVEVSGAIAISGTTPAMLNAYNGAQIECFNPTFTITGTPAWSWNGVRAASCARVSIGSITFSGAATGTRYDVSQNAIVDTFGGGATFIPGSVAGVTSSQGQYL